MQAPISVKRENTSEHEEKCTEGSHWNVSLTRRVHMSEKTGEPRKKHHEILTWAHISDSPRKIRMRGDQVGQAEPGQPPVQVHFDVE